MRSVKHPDMSAVELTDVMYALSDPARLEVVKKLARVQALPCGKLYDARSKSSMSHHFKILRASGIIETRIEGKEHLNSLRTADLDKRFPGLLHAILQAA